jgi:hypothetical protein
VQGSPHIFGANQYSGGACDGPQVGRGIAVCHVEGDVMKDRKKCAHPACDCLAEEGSKYCSQYCKDAGGTMELSCNCGHEGCALEAAVGSSPVAE